jgi:predicted metal-binding membrane protein
MNGGTVLEARLKRDRVVVMGALGVIAGLAWAYLGYLAWDMRGMDGGGAGGLGLEAAMPRMQAWTLVDLVTLFVMWSVMMFAMMLPSVSNMLLAFATINRRRRERQEPYVATAVFLCGYLLVWVGFSAVAVLIQWGLQSAALLSPMMVSTSPVLGGALLIAAGIFQWTPVKDVCLAHCRSPMGFILSDWREGTGGAVLMGLHHGAFCVGCCWVLMLLLFVAGVMNLLWVAAITVFVVIEKLAPRGDVVGRITGGVLVVAGVALLVQA